MISVLLKHWIYELCIDRLFKGIYKNFDICDRTLNTYKVGDYIPVIQVPTSQGLLNLHKCKMVYKTKNKAVLYCEDSRVPTYFCVEDSKRVVKIIAVHMAIFDDYEELFDE